MANERNYGPIGDNPFDLRRFATIGSPEPINPIQRAYRGVNFGPTMLGRQDFQQPAPQEEDPYVSALNRMGSGRATDAYRSHLSELPQQKDYAPSKWRKLGAALTAGAASFGRQPQNAMQLGEQVRDAPYRGALESWQLRGAGLKEQAGLEAADQAQQIARMKQILDYKDKQTDNERLDRAQRATEQYQRDTINARLQQGWQKDYGPNGELILVNPATHETMNTGMQTSKTTDIANDATRLGYEGTRVGLDRQRVGLEGARVGLEGQRVGLEGQRVGQAERGLGLQERSVATGEKNATTAATNSANRNFVAPGTNDAAQTLAARTIVMKHPEFAQYLDDKGFIKLDGEASATDDNYRAFLGMVAAEKNRVLSTRRPGG